jgi:mercuric ion binding protein
MKNLILVVFIALLSIGTYAQEKKNKNAKYDIEVNGNCGMCKKRIEKASYSVKGVKSAVWHQDHHDLHIIIDETKADVNEVHKAIAKVGHDTDKVRATDEDYESLHGCCQFDRKEQ